MTLSLWLLNFVSPPYLFQFQYFGVHSNFIICLRFIVYCAFAIFVSDNVRLFLDSLSRDDCKFNSFFIAHITAVQGHILKKYISNSRINAIFLLGMAKLSQKELNFHVSLINIFTKCIKPKRYTNFLSPIIIIH